MRKMYEYGKGKKIMHIGLVDADFDLNWKNLTHFYTSKCVKFFQFKSHRH